MMGGNWEFTYDNSSESTVWPGMVGVAAGSNVCITLTLVGVLMFFVYALL